MRIIGNDPKTPRQTQVVASGTLSTGDTVVVNSDGTVSAVAETAISQGVGSEVIFKAASVTQVTSVFDSNSNKLVIAYKDIGNSNAGTAVVGTVSGNSISFGTPTVFETGNTIYISGSFDTTNNKVIFAYQDADNSQYATSVVGTVSGTSISFGTPQVFKSTWIDTFSTSFDSNQGSVVIFYRDRFDNNNGKAIAATVSGTSLSFGAAVTFDSASGSFTRAYSSTFDSSNNKIVIFYKDLANSSYGTAKVCTVSGTSLSFGSASVFESALVTGYISSTFDTANNKTVTVYADGGNSNYGTSVVGTVSGTSISFGTPVVFNSATTQDIDIAFDSSINKVSAVYADGGNSYYGTAISGTVSGTSISFGSETVFNSGGTNAPSIVYDSGNQKLPISYDDGGNSNYGTSIVFQNAYTSANLTAENYIGTAKSGAADGDGVVVNTQGAIDENQSGLTAGQSYYVQTDGTLSTTAGDPSVFAGTAVSATKLIVKG